MKIQAAITEGDGTFSIVPLELGRPGAGEVLVAIKASGVCHTDFDSLGWKKRLILGHEGAGVVADVGAGVAGLRAGDRVMLNWAIPCGVCFQCARGAENICEDRGTVPDDRFVYPGGPLNASFSLGTMATHAIVPVAAVIPIPDDLPFEVGAILGCGVMTGFGSVVNAGRVAKGSSVAVLGCGGVGLSAILGAVYSEAGRIIAVDLSPSRLKLARQFGATETLQVDRNDSGLRDAAATVRRMNGGRGVDYCFECTAVPELGPAPLAMVRSGGTAVGVSGIEQVVPVNMELFEWDKIYINPLYGQCRPARDFPLLIDLYRSGRLPLDAMISRRYPLEHLQQALDDMRNGIHAKGVLTF
jgi:S-(hydroxymethyl)glutathione dehydrogenase/alcohol dehydrogenase